MTFPEAFNKALWLADTFGVKYRVKKFGDSGWAALPGSSELIDA